ncbi:DUF4252 domain-containing protein [uncultured Draconibacterium sp.]|uniref:DUF4252 domain-containing protein n=1 Tax=uncultured Draconibacterium sp. TaxID=1573823 RepID=UPI0032172981
MKTKFIIFFMFVSFIALAQNGNKNIDQALKLIDNRENASYFEVTKDMFQMLSDTRDISPEFKEYISKLHKLKMIQPTGEKQRELGEEFYKIILANTNLSEYTRLMTQRDQHSKLSFYKKEGKNENEFLLLSNNMIIYITGTLDLKSIHEFEQVIKIAGNAVGM